MNIRDIGLIVAIGLSLSLLLNNILEIKQLMNQIGMIIFIIILVALLYYKIISKKNMNSDKLFKKIFVGFLIITTIILVLKGFIHIYEKGGLKTANGLFTFLGMILIFVALTQIVSMNNTFNDMDELYKLMPSYMINKKANNRTNKTNNNKTNNNSNKANNNKTNNSTNKANNIKANNSSNKANI